MIRVTIWNEYLHEKLQENVAEIYPQGIHGTIGEFLQASSSDIVVKYATLEQDDEHGLSKEVLDNTDVLIWWGHMAHDRVKDEIVERVKGYVENGMGLIALHSAHHSKLMKSLLGTTLDLKWRHGDSENLWCINRNHPIAKGIPECIHLPIEEMYGEPFDIIEPCETIFLGWFSGGEVFRSGVTFNAKKGKIFYFQPGHEDYPIYHNKDIQQVIINAVNYLMEQKNG